MKRKKFSKRLVLNKNTVVNLNLDGLKAARGGTDKKTFPQLCAYTDGTCTVWPCTRETCIGLYTCDLGYTCNGAHTCETCTN